MRNSSTRGRLLATTIVSGAALAAVFMPALAMAQEASETVTEVVVTGSRIRRAETTTPAPVTVIGQEAITERGYVQAGEALNQVSSIAPTYGQADGSGSAAGAGQQFPNLFSLGSGRTLTLVNGRRTVTSSSGLGDRVVDANIIPVGLIKNVEIVQGGGAAVYGSDAIAGVVNYILKDDFEGVEMDAQYGISSRNDNEKPSLRVTAGKNFAEGRGNFAINAEWSKTDPLYDRDRPLTNMGRITYSNPADGGPNDGVSALAPATNAKFYAFNNTGVIFTTPAPVPNFFLRSAGTPQQFTASGDLAAYNPGTFLTVPFASGGDGFAYQDLATLRTGVERKNFNALGHYDINDHLKLSGELLYSNTVGKDPYGSLASNTVLNAPATGSGYIPFFATNPYLSATTLATLKASSPSFGFGAPLFLSKAWTDLLPTREIKYTTDTWRALLSLEGDFNRADRDFYWSLSASHGGTEGTQAGWDVNTARMAKAVAAVKNGAGQIVCGVNADANPANDDAACAPLNIFGSGNVSAEARAYVTAPSGQDYSNTQDDVLATLGGDLLSLPAGKAKFSAAYEYRHEWARYTPFVADQLGLLGAGVATQATSGKFHTNELSGEVLVPILGGDFTLPGAKRLEFDGSYRFVDHSVAGKEKVWGAGLQWEVVSGLTFRGSRSRNFRAPTLDQLFAPSRTALGVIEKDPCDSDRINAGPAPATRRANCQALFAAHPGYGPLATFQDPAENFNNTLITTGGNPDLKNEISDTKTLGVILQPTFIPGLTIIADRIEIDLTNGISDFTAADFLATCYDSSAPSPGVCGTFTRDANGYVSSAMSTTYNAGSVNYRGEVYNINYRLPLANLFPNHDYGTLEFGLEATHNTRYETSVTGFDESRIDGTVEMPDWRGRFDLRYSRGPLKLYYSVDYMPEALSEWGATIETTPNPTLAANIRHNISGSYDFGKYTVRAGVTDLTDEMTSYPSRSYGDIAGRQFFVGLNARF
ncbi:TonB-dependent receptor domain-containing protein [Caulobacter soli]|uniref:TonB-dependent receptor domain-containing protein n=1 Tax=Caulobacter soli TaxID=2708539 RepID=UPI0013EA6CE3|nr:TonB-dependent receptor [Caulobacter soli]